MKMKIDSNENILVNYIGGLDSTCKNLRRIVMFVLMIISIMNINATTSKSDNNKGHNHSDHEP